MDRILCLFIYLIVVLSRFSRFLAKFGVDDYDEWRPGTPMKILLVGYNGARNTGSDVRVVAIARQILELFGKERVHVAVMTLDAATLEGYFDDEVELLTFSSLFPWPLYRACRRSHAVVLCEGSTLKSTFANALTLFLCEAAGIMAAQKKPCVAYGSEVGQMEPFLERASKRLCKDAYFITRSQGSFEALEKLGLEGRPGTDAAWSYGGAISPEEAQRLLVEQGWDGVRPLLGVAVINPFCWPVRASLWKWIRGLVTGDLSGQYDKWYFFSDSEKRRREYRRYIEGVAEGANAFLKKYDYFPVLIGMERLDERACRDLRPALSGKSALFLSGDNSAAVMTGILRKLSALATSRYHAAVLSMERACPIVAISMDERLDGVMRELSLNDRYLLKTTDQDLGEKLTAALFRAVEEEAQIKQIIRDRLVYFKETLSEMGVFLKEYFENALERRQEESR